MGNLLDGLILVTRRGDLIFSWGRLKELNEVCTVSETVNVTIIIDNLFSG